MAHTDDIVTFGKGMMSEVAGWKRSQAKEPSRVRNMNILQGLLGAWKAKKMQDYETHVDQKKLENWIALGVANADNIKATEEYNLRKPWIDKIESAGFNVNDSSADHLYDEEAWKRARRSNKVFNSVHPESYLDYNSFDKAHQSGEISEGLYTSMSKLYGAEKKDLIDFVRTGKKFDPRKQDAYLAQLVEMDFDVGNPSLFNLVTGHAKRRIDMQDQAIDSFRDDFISKPVQNTLNDFALWETTRKDIAAFRQAAANTPPSGLDLIPNAHLEILAQADKRLRQGAINHITKVMESYSDLNPGKTMPQRELIQELYSFTIGVTSPGEGSIVLWNNHLGKRATVIAESEANKETPEELEEKLAKLSQSHKSLIQNVNYVSGEQAQKWLAQQGFFNTQLTKLRTEYDAMDAGPEQDIKQDEIDYVNLMLGVPIGSTSADIATKLDFLKNRATKRASTEKVVQLVSTLQYANAGMSTRHLENLRIDPEIFKDDNLVIHNWVYSQDLSNQVSSKFAGLAEDQMGMLISQDQNVPEDVRLAFKNLPADINKLNKLSSMYNDVRNVIRTNNAGLPETGYYLGYRKMTEVQAFEAVVRRWPVVPDTNDDPTLKFLSPDDIENILRTHQKAEWEALQDTEISALKMKRGQENDFEPILWFPGTENMMTMPDQIDSSGLSDDEIDTRVLEGRHGLTERINEVLDKTTAPQDQINLFNATIQERYGDGSRLPLLLPQTRRASLMNLEDMDFGIGDREGWIEFNDATGRYESFEPSMTAEVSALSEEALTRLMEEDERLSTIIEPDPQKASIEDWERRAAIRKVIQYSKEIERGDVIFEERPELLPRRSFRDREIMQQLLDDNPWLEDFISDEKVEEDIDTSIEDKLDTVANIFNDSQEARDLMREVTIVESNMGQTPGTYDVSTGLTGQKGSLGIAQIDEIAFNEIQRRLAAGNRMEKWVEPIEDVIDTDIREVKYEDLTDDTLNLIFARLYFMVSPRSIPNTVEGRAKLWKEIYNTSAGKGTIERYIDAVSTHKR